MSTEYIRMIFVRQDGVYLNSKSNNDNCPYRTWRCDSLSEIYREEGQAGLDREMFLMFCEYAQPMGSHSTIVRYRSVLESEQGQALYRDFRRETCGAYERLSEVDRKALFADPTTAGEQFWETVHRLRQKRYTALARLCAENDELRERKRGETDGERENQTSSGTGR